MVTHSMAQAVQFGDRVLVMHRGRVAYDLTDVRRQRWRKTTCCGSSTSCAGPTGWMSLRPPCSDGRMSSPARPVGR